MTVVAIAGYRDSGKTTLVERLVPVLKERGRVATVKSIHHDVDVDTPGKDTYRHREAGADAVVGLTPSLTFQVRVEGTDADRDPDESLSRGIDLLDDEYEFVVAEGFKSVDVPTILVGDIERDAVNGQVLTRVSTPRDADLGPLVTAIGSISTDP
ncbi:molybdopterin-guanine dinucleotide biosynthesis protein B [Halanaeroarchaeum sulfurireducens]|uniref:Molybdopterin-guanine dinucleotide biosynthesis protein B n=1 Tax=Halanaeroarchaeum sulfurireducens TaxID=1604004 RepID=A0A0F7P978_9EURY|nr:molybdopterin-guanine dinucleotide biosynthesis protein B [Halanaeroarchaeum sulfurireducens]AKH97686.1 molybdopterin-guanine dinucleotide biosynthesis protein B [Halanaeroarchaeum sulfurireducens]ALG82081.1 molybdopterin-guanine dinucleotide biosynthesis protein B [Halanaeroarchaeum sulfurireducens]